MGMFGASDWRKRRGPRENQDLGRWSLFSREVEVEVDVKFGSSGARVRDHAGRVGGLSVVQYRAPPV